MSVKVRLARWGAKKRPYYKVVISDSRSPRDGKFLEVVGTYNPLDHTESRVNIKADRVKDWLHKGAQPTDTVAKLLRKLNIISA